MSKPVLEDLFALEGRRNRQSYILYNLLLVPVGLLCYAAAWHAPVLGLMVVIPLFISSWLVGAQRCRDFGWTGWAMLIALIPVVGGFFVLALLFIPGTAGENRYGTDPLADPFYRSAD